MKKSVGLNSTSCSVCDMWVYKICIGVRDKMDNIAEFEYATCRREGGRDRQEQIALKNVSFTYVEEFSYLEDVISASNSVVTVIRSEWRTLK